MPANEQLKYRYLIAVEGAASVQHPLRCAIHVFTPSPPTTTGNDVASGLKWMLASNSVVFMPLPRYETWIEESMLEVRLRPPGNHT